VNCPIPEGSGVGVSGDAGANPYGIRFTADPGQTWDARDQGAVLDAAAHAARAMRAALVESYGSDPSVASVPDAATLFRETMGPVIFHQSASSCQTTWMVGCWAFTDSPVVTIYTEAPQGRYNSQNAAHEMGHLFAQRAGRQPYNDLDAASIALSDGTPIAGGGWAWGYQRTNNGYVLTNGRTWPWQQNTAATANEDFADMFLGWSYNHFASDAAGAARYGWMQSHMPGWIDLARGR